MVVVVLVVVQVLLVAGDHLLHRVELLLLGDQEVLAVIVLHQALVIPDHQLLILGQVIALVLGQIIELVIGFRWAQDITVILIFTVGIVYTGMVVDILVITQEAL